VIVSLNEIENLATKAARGAGFAWGMAEEVGFAARWLMAHDLDGIAAVDALLALPDACRGGAACPIRAGTRLADGAVRELPWTSPELVAPLLLLPFAAHLAEDVRTALTLACDGALIEIMPGVDGGQVAIRGDLSALRSTVRIARCEAPSIDAPSQEAQRDPGPAHRTGCEPTCYEDNRDQPRLGDRTLGTLCRPRLGERVVDDAAWARLSVLEGRTHVPASMRSRRTGAGGRLADND
jgi:hypothetical protein